MILVDTGPLVALFDPRDAEHPSCRTILQGLRDPLVTTIPVLTEAFHMLGPAGRGARNLRSFVQRGGLSVWFMDSSSPGRVPDACGYSFETSPKPPVSSDSAGHEPFKLVFRPWPYPAWPVLERT